MLKRCIGIIYLSVLVACSNQPEIQSRPQLEQYGIRQFKKGTETAAHFYFCEYDNLDAWGCAATTPKTLLTQQNAVYTADDAEAVSTRDRVRERLKRLQASNNRNIDSDGESPELNNRSGAADSTESRDAAELVDGSVLLATVNFDFAKHRLTKSAKDTLTSVLDDPGIKEHRILVFGYTDSIGGKKYNDNLALMRAQAVTEYLISGGLEPSNLLFDGRGLCCYIRENDTESNRKYNRRVEVRVQPRNQGNK